MHRVLASRPLTAHVPSIHPGDHRVRWAALALGGILLCSGCDLTRYFIRRSGPAFGQAVSVLAAYRDPELARQAAPPLLALLEGLLASDPENQTLLRILSQGIYEHTFGFLHTEYERVRQSDASRAETLRRRARAQYVKVYELGLRLLRLRGVSITLQRSSETDIQRQMARLDRRAVPALTWTAVGAGSALMLGLDQPWLMQMRGKIPKLLERAAALAPGYANALPVGALALYWGRSAMTGGSALRSKRYFEQAIRLTGRRYLLWHVMYAHYWAWQFQAVTTERVGFGPSARELPVRPRNKRALFVKLLSEVDRFPLDRAPASRLANTLAKRIGRRLMLRRNDFLEGRARNAATGLASRNTRP